MSAKELCLSYSYIQRPSTTTMKILTSYSVRIQGYGSVLDDTVAVYRKAVDFFIAVMMGHWDLFEGLGQKDALTECENLCIRTAKRPTVLHDFSVDFYKFPSYLRRATINAAFGAVSSYKTRLAQWQVNLQGKEPGLPKAGRIFPAFYKAQQFEWEGRYCARIKVFIRNTWDWITVPLRKTDVDYINLYCAKRKALCPTVTKRGKVWSLDFAYEEKVDLNETDIEDQVIVAVDLGINNAATAVVMRSDGTVLERRFLRLSKEKDSLERALGRIRNAQRHGAKRMPRLWGQAKGINDDIARKTAAFILDTAIKADAHVVVMEHLDLKGRKRGSKRWRLHHWRAQYVQEMVESKAHRAKMRVSRVCAWGTSRLAFDGSGRVTRDADNYSLCTFATGKRYHADLNAALNIGARYFIRERLKSLPETARQALSAKVPEVLRRSTCTLCSLFRFCAELGTQGHPVSELNPHRAKAVPRTTNGGSRIHSEGFAG